jgi:hypothetical protein
VNAFRKEREFAIMIVSLTSFPLIFFQDGDFEKKATFHDDARAGFPFEVFF